MNISAKKKKKRGLDGTFPVTSWGMPQGSPTMSRALTPVI